MTPLSTDFLTPEECAAVDQALLTAHDKFTARVAIYALRSLKTIAHQHHVSIAELQPQQIVDWVNQDDSLQPNLDPDELRESSQKFRQFFSNLVVSALNPLNRIAQEFDTELEQLTISQVIAWFEAEAKKKLNLA